MTRFRRVIALGFDGLDPHIIEGLRACGRLPNLSRLAELGGYSRLRTTWPAQTPVAWSTFATGLNPGGHGIFDFVRRNKATYQPELALSHYQRRSALLPPSVVNSRQGTPFWETLALHDVPATVIRCPCTYPPQRFGGRLLAGMGVPDARGGIGTATVFSSNPGETAQDAERVALLSAGQNQFSGTLTGPRAQRAGEDFTAAVSFETHGEGVTVCLSDPERRVELHEGEWSPWLRVRFRYGRFQRLMGMVRLRVVAIRPQLVVYSSPVNFDPAAPLFPVSHPASYASDLNEAIGDFATAGFVEDHSGLSNGRFGHEGFLESCRLAMREREAMVQFELARCRDGFLFCLFDTPDRLQHMFWRFREPDHPASRHLPREDRDYLDAIDTHMVECDEVIGRALSDCDDETLVLILSDHGFGSFRRSVHLNSWLRSQGLLQLRPGSDNRASADAPPSLPDVDWNRTTAFAIGLGGIYLNVRGREAQGIVEPGDARETATRIARALEGMPDQERGGTAIRAAHASHELYEGSCAGDAPDVMVGCADGYRVSWETALGGVPSRLVDDNRRHWSGDHIVDPALVPGVLFSNRALASSSPTLLDVAPTILSALGVPVPGVMKGEDLLVS
jgi:predicted AlkP superfamily phosphohydrolase/phosphomutase